MRKVVHMDKETWTRDGTNFALYWCGIEVIVEGQRQATESELASGTFDEYNKCRNCLRAKNRQRTFVVKTGIQYSGKLGTIPALFKFKRAYSLVKGMRVEFMDTIGQDNGRWLTGIVDGFIDSSHKYIFISKF